MRRISEGQEHLLAHGHRPSFLVGVLLRFNCFQTSESPGFTNFVKSNYYLFIDLNYPVVLVLQ